MSALVPPTDIDWSKAGGLLPAVIQHVGTGEVLMLGYMNEAALKASCESGWVTFFSRSRQRLWRKGETSGNGLALRSLSIDCDRDTLLVQALPQGPTCHRGTRSCFDSGGESQPPLAGSGFLPRLDAIVADRCEHRPEGSYTTRLFEAGIRRIAQKVGEEGVETALAAVAQDDTALLGEAADLVFHLLVLLRARGLGWDDVEAVLAERHASTPPATGH